MPVVHRLVPSETVVRNVVREQVQEPLAVQVVVVLNVVLLRRDHGKVLLLLTPIFAEFYSPHILLIDQVCCHAVLGWIVPRGKNLFPGGKF